MKTRKPTDELFEAVREAAAAGDGEAALELVGRNWREWHTSSQLDQGSAAAGLALEAGKSSRSIWRTRTLYADGIFAFRMGDMARSQARNEEALAIARETGDTRGECDALTGLARVALRAGRYADVVTLALEGRDKAMAAGDQEAEASPLHLQAAGIRLQGRYDEARDLYVESLRLNARLGAAPFVAMEHHNLGWVELHLGNVESAAAHFLERDATGGDDAYGKAWSDLNWAGIAIESSDHAEAQRRFEQGTAALDRLGVALDPDDRFELDWLSGRLGGKC